MTAVSLSTPSTNLPPAAPFHHEGEWKSTLPAGSSAPSPMTLFVKSVHTRSSDQYQALREAYKFFTVTAIASDRWDATDITSTAD